jgi:hypothetical protein
MPSSRPPLVRLVQAAFAAVVLVLALGAASAQARPQVRNVRRARTPRGIVVRALASGGLKPLPLRGARVKVVTGDRVIARGRVGSLGMGLVGNHRRLPRTFELVVSGGRIGHRRFGGRLVTEVRGYRAPQTVHVDFVTTLAARYERAHPSFSPRRVRRSVRRFLELPGTYVIGLDGRTDVAFDGRRFLGSAGTGHHYERFVGKLVRQMGNPRAHRSFAAPGPDREHRAHKAGKGASTLSLSGARPLILDEGNLSSLDGVTSAISSGSGFFAVLEKSATLLDFVNAGLAIDGAIESAHTQEEIEELGEQLQEVEQSLAVVQQTVDKMQRENQETAYGELAAKAEETQTAVQSGEDTLQSAAQLFIQDDCAGVGKLVAGRCDEIAGLLTGKNGFMANMKATGLDTPGKVNDYAENIAGDALPAAPRGANGLIQDASKLAYGSPEKVFFTAPASQELRSAAAYWISSYTEAMSLVGTYWALDGANQLTLENDVDQVEEFAAGMPAAVPDSLEGEAVDAENGMMVSTLLGRGTLSPSYGELAAGTWGYDTTSDRWVSSDGLELRPTGFLEGGLTFSNWQVAGVNQVHTLQAQVGGGLAGEAIVSQTAMPPGIFNPSYPADGWIYQGSGLEYEYMLAGGEGEGPGPGCIGSAWTCVWAVWDGNREITDVHRSRGSYLYEDGSFEVPVYDLKWYGYPLWGFDNSRTIYGGEPIEDIPFLFYRQVGPGECYYYPVNVPAGGSPGCPG